MQSEKSEHETGDASEKRQRTPRTARGAHLSVMAAALAAVVTGAAALSVAAPLTQSAPAAAESIAVDASASDEAELPESPTAGFSDAATRFAEGAATESPALAASAYGATTPEELIEIHRSAREALIRAAVDAGIEVDLSRLSKGDLAPLDEFLWPIANPVLTDQFGARGGRHMGMDIAAAGGTPITAAAPGIVVLSSESYYGYGVAVMIQHVNGVQTLYGHMTYGSRIVKEGDWVEAGDPIGLVGNTGHSFGNHLHFETRVNGKPVDPRRYLEGAGKPVDVDPWRPKPTEPAPSQPAPSPAEPKPSDPPTSPAPKPSEPAPKPTDPAPKPTPTEPAPSPKPTDPAPKPTPTEPAPKPTPTEPAPSPKPTDPAPPKQPSPTPTEPAPAPSEPAPSTPAPTPSQPANTPSPTPTSPMTRGLALPETPQADPGHRGSRPLERSRRFPVM